MDEPLTRLARLVRRNQTMEFSSIEKAAEGRSRRSLFRDLVCLGYLTSYTHAGRYYTLRDIPHFDEHGLWFYKGIGFSRAGTLKMTLVELIEAAEAGYTHNELKALLHVRAHNTLLVLVHEKRINREPIEKQYVYVSVKTQRSAEQLARRREEPGAKVELVFQVPVITVIEVLIEVIRAGKVLISPAEVAKRLSGRGIIVRVNEAEQVFDRYGLNTVKSRPRRGICARIAWHQFLSPLSRTSRFSKVGIVSLMA